ncbi:MAG TPA: biopolymer transporter ExbD [Verrucomicrobiae bacterium]|nr:biopolymer transporter ExbD [Verrucomicrobiae bacterium]
MKLKRRQIKRGRIEIIPMIDTIVILLIFYMSFSRFAELQRDASIKLPQSVVGADFTQSPNQIIVNMGSSDNVTVAGHRYKIGELSNLLSHMKTTDPGLNSLILRGSRDMNYKDLSAFLKVCSRAGIADVTFATLEK